MSYFIGIDLKKYEDDLNSIELNTDLDKVNSHHITIFPLGNLKDYRLKRIVGRMKVFEKESFSIKADGLYAFSEDENDRFLALGFENRRSLYDLLFELIEYLEEMPTGGTGLQHITLYRTADKDYDLPEMERKRVGDIRTPIDIEVDNIVLYKSNSKESGILNDYQEILRVPLI